MASTRHSQVSDPCPPPHQLQAFVIGDLSEADFERVASHVALCVACESRLEELDELNDPLVSELSGLSSRFADLGTDSRIHLLPAAARSTAGSSDATFDRGRQLARQLSDGPCRLGRFELQAEIGEGSFGHVFRARDIELGRTVAVKVQRAGSFANDDEVRRFLREAQSAAQLDHPQIVAIYDTGQTDDGVGYLVTQFIDGDTLEQRLARRRSEPNEAARLVAELAETLQYAHDHGVIHRDVKPSNIILDAQDKPHITDFGLAKQTAGDSRTTSDGRIMGTPSYMSPEQARGESHRVDQRTDIYSLGVVLYELLTGERPFQGHKRLLVLQVMEDEPRAPRVLNSRVPRDLETICLKAMAKSPARRYATANEMAADLRRYVRGEPILARPISPGERLARWCRRYPLAAGLLLAVSIGSAFGFWYLSRLSRFFVEATALDSVRMEAEMLQDFNDFYSDRVVGTLDWDKVPVSKDYSGKDDTVPLPATLLIDVGEYISQSHSGMEFRLYSNNPFRDRGGPKDEFERRAITTLNRSLREGNPMPSYYEFTEKDGRQVVRYARAQIMKDSCVKCHNSDPTSPKRNWQKGELAGVLAITRPLDQDIDRTRTGLRGAFALVGSIGTFLFGLSLAFVLAGRLKSRRLGSNDST